ncbi:MAG: hypothetical protein ACJ763_03220 [Bdellovibrionia bacterium]
MMRKNNKELLVIALSALAVTGCLMDQKKVGALLASSSSSSQQQFSGDSCQKGGGPEGAFQNTFYPLARVNCISCHGSTQSPMFAVSNVSAAFSAAQDYINYNRVTSSPFMTKLKDGHCGPQCVAGSPISNSMIAALSDWAAGANSAVACPTPTPTATEGVPPPTDTSSLDINPNVTNAISMPASVPNNETKTFAIMRWDLGTISPNNPELNGVIFELKVQTVGLNGYVFSVPRLATKNYPIYVKNLQILINGNYDRLGNVMSDVEATVNNVSNYTIPAITSQMTPFPALSSRNAILAQGNGPGTDKISLAFGEIHKAAAPTACKALNTFKAKVLPVFLRMDPYFQTVPTCMRCHDTAAPYKQAAAIAAFDMTNATNNAAALCAAALQRVDRNDLIQSVLISAPLNLTAFHPADNYYDNPGLTSDLVAPAWIDWMNEEIDAQ